MTNLHGIHVVNAYFPDGHTLPAVWLALDPTPSPAYSSYLPGVRSSLVQLAIDRFFFSFWSEKPPQPTATRALRLVRTAPVHEFVTIGTTESFGEWLFSGSQGYRILTTVISRRNQIC